MIGLVPARGKRGIIGVSTLVDGPTLGAGALDFQRSNIDRKNSLLGCGRDPIEGVFLVCFRGRAALGRP